MKPAAFNYLAPTSIAESVARLAEAAGEDARVLAGGQTLIPAMAMRLARPSHLIDINAVEGLGSIDADGATLSIGACVRHASFHRPVTNGPLGALLSDVVRHIAHLPIRTRGTFCGSLANADAASEWCLVSTTLDGTMVACSVRGERRLAAAQFFRGFMATALEPDEILVSAVLPRLSTRTGFGFTEFSRRAGDFAQAMALVLLECDGTNISSVRVGIGGVEAAPRRLTDVEGFLEGSRVTADVFQRAAEVAAAAVEPTEATEELQSYKRRLVRAAVLRSLSQAVERSMEQQRGRQ